MAGHAAGIFTPPIRQTPLPDWMAAMIADEGDGRRLLPCADLLDAGLRAQALQPYLGTATGAARIARLSHWSQYYLANVCLPLPGRAALTGQGAPVAPQDLAVVLDEAGLPVAVRVMGPAQPGGLRALVERHLRPVLAALATEGPIAGRVLWGNAAHYLEWFSTWLAEVAPEELPAAQDLLRQPRLADGSRNPLCGAIHYCGEVQPENRRRKVCCLRYRLEGVADCGSLCPTALSERQVLA